MFYANHAVFLLAVFTAVCDVIADERCQFPRAWKGKWYQSGLGEVVIRERLITKKGSCFDHQRDYYLVRNRNDDCFQCLLLMDRHKNIIQYKESYCVPRDSLRNICAQIRVETPLYTLVREPAIPTKCPFKDAFYFDYNDQASGPCETPISYAKPCAGHTKYQLHFKHCKEYAMFHNSDLDLTCVANWKDGSDTYMYAQFSGPGIATKDQSYRCFKYQHYGTEMFVAMSVDATCQGLRSPQDGPVTMEFSKDIFGWPPPSCNYPDWLADVTWRDIDGRHTFSFVADTRVMTGYYRKRMHTNPEVQSEHRCVQVMEESSNKGERTAIVYSFTTHKCMSKHQCLKFKRDAEGKVQFYQGAMGEYESGNVCLGESEYGEPQILMEENPEAVECPLKGSYLMQDGEGCHQRISIGCQNKTLLTFSATCDDVQAQSVVTLQCILTWEDSGRTYLLAKEPGADTRLVNCFTFKERHNAVHYTTDRKCGSVASGQLDKSVKYELLQRETCLQAAHSRILRIPLPPNRTESTSGHSSGAADNAADDYLDFNYDDNIEITDESPRPPAGGGTSSRDKPRYRGNRRRDRYKQREKQRDKGRSRNRGSTDDVDSDGSDEDWLALSDADLLPMTRAPAVSDVTPPEPEVREKPYPKYSQVDESTDGATREHRTSSSSSSSSLSYSSPSSVSLMLSSALFSLLVLVSNCQVNLHIISILLTAVCLSR